MPRYDYICGCGWSSEERRGYDEAVIPCRSCGSEAKRVSVYAHQCISGETVAKGRYASRAGNIKDPKGRTRVSLFKEASEEIAYAEDRADEAAGRKLPRRSLYREGLREAQRRGARLRV